MSDLKRFFIYSVAFTVACAVISAVIILMMPEPEPPKKLGRIEMCPFTIYDSAGVAIDSGYFPVVLIDNWRAK